MMASRSLIMLFRKLNPQLLHRKDKEGRKDREKTNYYDFRMNPNASTTNREKSRKKAYTMIKHKVMRKKNKRSFKDKQVALRNSLLKRQKAKKH